MKQFTQEEKAALLLRSLPPPLVDSVLAKLPPERGTRLRSLLQNTSKAEADGALDQIWREIERMLPAQQQASVPAPAPSAAQVASAYASASVAAPAVEELPADPVAALADLEPEQLAAALSGENPRTVGLILNQLSIERAGQLFKCLPGDLRREVSVQFSNTVTPGPQILERIAHAVVRKARLLKETPAEPSPDVRFRRMAGMVRVLEREERKQVLAALEERDPEAAAAIKSQLYQFEDLLKIEKRSMQKLLGELDTKNLALAIKSAEPAIKEKVMNNMSQRAQQTLNEEMEFIVTTDHAAIEQARKIIVDTIQRLDQSGDLVMAQE